MPLFGYKEQLDDTRQRAFSEGQQSALHYLQHALSFLQAEYQALSCRIFFAGADLSSPDSVADGVRKLVNSHRDLERELQATRRRVCDLEEACHQQQRQLEQVQYGELQAGVVAVEQERDELQRQLATCQADTETMRQRHGQEVTKLKAELAEYESLIVQYEAEDQTRGER